MIPSDIKWDPNATPPQFTNNDDTVIQPGTHVRCKIIGTRSEVGGMWAIGSIKEDYLGYVVEAPGPDWCGEQLLTLSRFLGAFSMLDDDATRWQLVKAITLLAYSRLITPHPLETCLTGGRKRHEGSDGRWSIKRTVIRLEPTSALNRMSNECRPVS